MMHSLEGADSLAVGNLAVGNLAVDSAAGSPAEGSLAAGSLAADSRMLAEVEQYEGDTLREAEGRDVRRQAVEALDKGESVPY